MPDAPSSDHSASDHSVSAPSGLSTRTKRLLGVAVVALVLLGLALPKLLASDGGDSGSSAQQSSGQESDTLSADAYVVAPARLADRLFTTGTLRASESVELASETAGKITRILFEEGSRVRRGELLVQINDSEFQAEKQRLEYELALAEEREARQRQLLEKGGISQDEYDAVLNRVNVLRSELDLVEAQIEKTKIRAPFDGTIGLRYVSEGSYVSPQARIASLRQIRPIKIDLSVPEKYVGRVAEGDTISFAVAGAGGPQRATVYAIEPSVAEDTRTLQLRARHPNPSGQLLPGAFADAEVIFRQIDSALTVPQFAVLTDREGQQVFILKSGRAQPQRVETGIRTDSTVQITQGLAAGDTVLTSNVQQLRSGAVIRVSSSDSTNLAVQ